MNAGAKQPAVERLVAAEKAASQGKLDKNKPVFKFTKPPKSNKTGVFVAVDVVLFVAAFGGYYAYNAFIADTSIPNPGIRPPEVVINTPPTIPTTTTTTPPVTTITTPPTTTTTTVTTPVTTTTPEVYIPRVRKPISRAVPSKTLNPWNDQDAGVWFRLRMTRGSQVTYKDIGLKEKGKDFNIVLTQTSQTGAPTEARIPVATVYLRGEETFTFEGQSFLCEIQTPTLEEGNVRTWSLLSGKNPGAVLKSESPEGSFTANRVWEHTLRVKGNPLECLVIEGQIQSGGSSRSVKNWYCGSLPIGLIQQQKDGELTEIVDLGDDWSKRPAFPK